jgi:type VI secretion system secreted protein Hcp
MPFHSYASFKGKTQGTLKGESIKSEPPRRDKWMELTGYSFGVASPRDSSSGSGTGNRRHQPVNITKEFGAASPQLLSAHWKSEIFDEVIIEQVSSPKKGGKEQVVERITLTNATISRALVYVGKSLRGRSVSRFGITAENIRIDRFRRI